MKRIFALFPGQGSQKVGMGKELYDRYPAARARFDAADQALGFKLSELCFNGPEAELTATAVAQPAILTVSTICYELATELHGAIVGAAGHSLGEYSALVAAGAIDFQDGVRLVHQRGSYMQRAVPAGAGKMVAVLGKEVAVIEAALAKVTQGTVQIANDNAPGQVVVAGSKEAVDEFLVHLGSGKARELAVSAPFHCALMKPAEDALRAELQKLAIRCPKFPVYSNFHAAALSEPEAIREALAQQVCGRVRWVESMQLALAETSAETAVEFGFGEVLTGLLKRINPEFPRTNLYTPEGAAAI